MFSTGISRAKLSEIQQVSGFKLGVLPVKYLCIPLITRRLSDNDCVSLVERITARINHWASKLLSYAGRLQLIQTVIYIALKIIGVANLCCLRVFSRRYHRFVHISSGKVIVLIQRVLG